MKTSHVARNPVLRSAALAALGFGFGLALSGLIGGALNYQIHDFNTGLLLGSILYAGAGALGGASLVWDSRSPRRALRLALAAAVGLGLGYFITTTIVSVWIDEHVQGTLIWTFVFIVQYALIGALAGLLLGLVQPDRWRTVWLVLAGLIGFGLLYWPLQTGMSLFIDPIWRLLGGSNGIAELPPLNMVGAASGFVSGALRGALLGACLGVGNSNLHWSNPCPVATSIIGR
jgi:hypothetical protein